MPKLCSHAKAVATVAVMAGAGALAYVGYKYYKIKLQQSDSKEKDKQKSSEKETEPLVREVEPEPATDSNLPTIQTPFSKPEDAVPQPTESFIMIPPKEPEPTSDESFMEPQVHPPFLPEDAVPQPAESFILLPPKDQDDKPQVEFDPSVDTTPVKNSDESNDNSFIKLSMGNDDEKLPHQDLSDLPLPIQKLDELADLPMQLEEQVKNLPETLAEAEQLHEDSHHE